MHFVIIQITKLDVAEVGVRVKTHFCYAQLVHSPPGLCFDKKGFILCAGGVSQGFNLCVTDLL